jgi:hypothetical protein
MKQPLGLTLVEVLLATTLMATLGILCASRGRPGGCEALAGDVGEAHGDGFAGGGGRDAGLMTRPTGLGMLE